MLMNTVLRPASLTDVPTERLKRWVTWVDGPRTGQHRSYWRRVAIRKLYDAEWKKRGFERSP
jgi:hypothetical protein